MRGDFADAVGRASDRTDCLFHVVQIEVLLEEVRTEIIDGSQNVFDIPPFRSSS
jgi:hypothetical protein